MITLEYILYFTVGLITIISITVILPLFAEYYEKGKNKDRKK